MAKQFFSFLFSPFPFSYLSLIIALDVSKSAKEEAVCLVSPHGDAFCVGRSWNIFDANKKPKFFSSCRKFIENILEVYKIIARWAKWNITRVAISTENELMS